MLVWIYATSHESPGASYGHTIVVTAAGEIWGCGTVGFVGSEHPFRRASPAAWRLRSRAASAPMSASGRPCGAAPDDAAAPAGHVPLPACELNNLLPERPAAAAEGWWPALWVARRSAFSFVFYRTTSHHRGR
jgi:hypothetical protein